MYTKDLTIIGGGVAGYAAAIHASQLGAKVALIEKDTLGGTCLNRGCIPTKALVRSIELYRKIRQARDFGIAVENVSIDLKMLLERKNRIVKRLVAGVEQLLKGNHIDIYRGRGSLLSPHEVRVNNQVISTARIILTSGSEPARLSIPGVNLPGVFTTDTILDMETLPETLIIIGGGPIGFEFAGIYSALGSRVIILEALPRCLHSLDDEISNLLFRTLRRQCIETRTGVQVKSIEPENDLLKVTLDNPDGEDTVRGQAVLMAAGRWPYTAGLGLEKLGISLDRRAVAVNEYLETGTPGVYAAGDVLGKSMLAHVAYYEAELAVKNALGDPQKVDYRVIPECIFTWPEIASVGITETRAREEGLLYKVSKFPYGASGAALTMNEPTGLVKMICDSDKSTILGVHIIGAHAGELIAEIAMAMKMHATAGDIANTIHAHPTLAENIREAALGQLGGAIHILRL